ncbi:hypothetical protein IFR05_010496 [Cadophora sp. M221]|nr:hypothetical protein IFR05_010496 [Cadophora sp. M221]
MENTGSKRRAEDTGPYAGNKRPKPTDAHSPLEEIAANNQVEMNPYSDYAIGSTMAFIESEAGGRGQRPCEKVSIQEYPSIQDMDYLHSEDINIITTSDVTLQSMMRPCTSAGGPVLRVGDTITFRVFGDNFKEIEITRKNGSHTIPTTQGPFVLPNVSLMVSVPRGTARQLNGPNGNIAFPNDVSRDRITAPTSIWKAARSEYPPAPKMPGEGKETWENMRVTRAGEDLGTLHELRLALQFSMNEADFAAQLTFSEGRSRRTTQKDASNASKAGFYMLNSGTLFLKALEDAVQGLNQDLLIDLGAELNEKLASLAEDGYSIVLVDSRGSHADGIPIPDDEDCMRKVQRKGPAAFPTEYTKKVAGYSGWTNGRAHMGFPSLCRNDEGQIEILAPFKYLHRNPGMPSSAVPVDEQVVWTKAEENNVAEFHREEMNDLIQHYPLPLTRSRRPSHIRTMQYRKVGDGWIVDSRVHPEVHNEDVFAEGDFDMAMAMPRTRAIPSRRKPKKFVDHEKYEGAPWAGYETLGRIVPDKNGRNATLEARFEGYKDN